MISCLRQATLAAFFSILAGCAQWPGFAPPPSGKLTLAQAPASFRVEGRVSVNAEAESFSGGMVWRHDHSSEELLLRTPLGQGVAELRGGPGGVELEDAEGRVHRAADADELVRQALGMELPLRGLAWWIVGHPRPGVPYRARPDEAGLLAALDQDGWHIEFSRYRPQGRYQVPGKLVAARGDKLEIRLVMDRWELP